MDTMSLITALSVMSMMEESEMMEKPEWYPMHRPYGDGPYPEQQQDIWIMRDNWEQPELTWVSNIHPAMNVIGLYWSPAKDGEGPPEWFNRNEL